MNDVYDEVPESLSEQLLELLQTHEEWLASEASLRAVRGICGHLTDSPTAVAHQMLIELINKYVEVWNEED